MNATNQKSRYHISHAAIRLGRDLMLRQPLLTVFSALMLVLALPTFILLVLDGRLLRDVPIWLKPLKFMLSSAMFAATTAWFIGLLPASIRTSSMVRGLAWTVVITSVFEVGYISLQAALGQGSHHNVSDPMHASLFGLMAIAAVCLTSTQAVLAWLIARHSPLRETLFVRSVVIGLVLTFVLATASGFMLGAQQPPAGVGLPIVGWHLGQADARPAHFLGLHAHQLIPMAGWFLQRYQVPQAGLWLSVLTAAYVSFWTVLMLMAGFY